MMQKFILFRKTGLCFSFFLVFLLGAFGEIVAQQEQGIRLNPLAEYTFEAENSSFTPLQDGTAVPSISADEAVTTALPIGFTYQMGGNDYTTFYASSNGTISFKKAVGNGNPSVSNGPILSPLWADLSGVGGVFSYETIGAAPNRVFTAEWKNWRWNYQTANVISFQVKIYEGTNSVEYIYNQEANINRGTANAAIGIFYEASNRSVQTWLTDPGATPGVSATLVKPIATRPATGQLYRFTMINNDCEYYGQTMINPTGGIKPMGIGYDGIRMTLTGAGNMQIRRKGTFQIYNSNTDVLAGTSNPYNYPGTLHGLVLSIGTSAFISGTLKPGSTSYPYLTVVSSTKQSLIQSGNTWTNVIKLSAVKNGLTYLLEVKYTYIYPESNFLIDYKVTIPEGNTEEVRLAHGWDTYLEGNDNGPGHTVGDWDKVTDTSPIGFIVGTKRAPSYEAFQYLGGIPWSGYFTDNYSKLNSDLGSTTTTKPWMTFKHTETGKYADGKPKEADNGIGISMNFGSAPGVFESNNAVLFACDAGDFAPEISSTTIEQCKGTSVNLNNYLVSRPWPGITIQWKDKDGNLVPDPANVNVSGVYSVSFYSRILDCNSPEAPLTITYKDDCGICYKPAVTTGTVEPIKTIISTLDRTIVPRNWSDPRAGSLIMESKSKGFVLTRMASPETAITAPVKGMMVYDTVNNIIKFYNGTVWKPLTKQSCPD